MDRPYLSGTASDQPANAADLVAKHALMFLAKGFEDVEAACILDVLGWTNYRPSIATVHVHITGFAEEVRGTFGTTYRIDVPFERIEPERYDTLVIPGGFHNLGFDEALDGRLGALAGAFAALGRPIATLCVGVLPLALAGLLEGGRAATYALSSRHDNEGTLREHGCTPSQNPVVDCDGIISCAGPAYSEQVAYALLEKLVGPEAASEVRRFRSGRDTVG